MVGVPPTLWLVVTQARMSLRPKTWILVLPTWTSLAPIDTGIGTHNVSGRLRSRPAAKTAPGVTSKAVIMRTTVSS